MHLTLPPPNKLSQASACGMRAHRRTTTTEITTPPPPTRPPTDWWTITHRRPAPVAKSPRGDWTSLLLVTFRPLLSSRSSAKAGWLSTTSASWREEPRSTGSCWPPRASPGSKTTRWAAPLARCPLGNPGCFLHLIELKIAAVSCSPKSAPDSTHCWFTTAVLFTNHA